MLGAPCSPCCTTRANCLDITLSGFSLSTTGPQPESIGSPWVEWYDKPFDYNQTASFFATGTALDGYDAWNGSASGYGKTQMIFDTTLFQYGPEFTPHAYGSDPVGGVACRMVVAKYKWYVGAGQPDDEYSEITFGFGGVLYYKSFASADESNPFKNTLSFTSADVVSNTSNGVIPGSVTLSTNGSSNAESSSVFTTANEVHISIEPYSQNITLGRSGANPDVFTYANPNTETNISLTVKEVACGVRKRLYLSLSGQVQFDSEPVRFGSFAPEAPLNISYRFRYMPDLFYGPYFSSTAEDWPTLPITYFSGPSSIEAAGWYASQTITRIDDSVTITIDGVS